MPQRKFFVATRVLLLDFDLFIGDRFQAQLSFLNPLQEFLTQFIILTDSIHYLVVDILSLNQRSRYYEKPK